MDSNCCSKCFEIKDISFFEKRVDSKNGHRRVCRTCRAVQTKIVQKRWQDTNSIKYWNLRAKSLNSSGSRRNGKAGKIIKASEPLKGEDLGSLYRSNPFCRYCKLQLLEKNVVFDHKIPLSRDGLHNIENLDIVCKDCNMLKNTRTSEEFEAFLVEYIKRFANPVVS